MNRLFKVSLAALMALSLAACSADKPEEPAAAGSDTVKGTYTVEITGFDWGCGTTKAIVTLDNPLDSAAAENFTVTETKQATDCDIVIARSFFVGADIKKTQESLTEAVNGFPHDFCIKIDTLPQSHS